MQPDAGLRCARGFGRIEVLVVVTIVLAAATVTFNVAALGPQDAKEKAACLANLRYIALAALMYASDNDNALPPCVATDREGTAHAVGGVFTNRRWMDFEGEVREKYGGQYADGRWMWHLADVLRPYVRSEARFNCPTLTWRDPNCRVQSYIVGTDATGKQDPHDPLRALIHGKRPRKIQHSGSYVYMCAHYDRGSRDQPSEFGAGGAVLEVWMAAQMLGFVAVHDDPSEAFACGNHMAAFSEPAREPLAMCGSFGVHEGYRPDYATDHVIPAEIGGNEPTIQPSIPVAFVDGHVDYVQMSFYDLLALLVSPNESR